MRAFGPGAKWDDVPDAASIVFNWLAMWELHDLGEEPGDRDEDEDEPADEPNGEDGGSMSIGDYV